MCRLSATEVRWLGKLQLILDGPEPSPLIVTLALPGADRSLHPWD